MLRRLAKKLKSIFARIYSSATPEKSTISPLQHNSKDQMDAFYADKEFIASYLDPLRLKFYQTVVDYFVTECDRYHDKRVADIGCGTGHLLLAIAQQFSPASLTGLEYSEKALEIARSILPQAALNYYDIYTRLNQEFDIIFCTEVLEHLLYPDVALGNILKAIAPDGQAIITVPDGRIDTFNGHINFWSPESWAVFANNQALAAGLTVKTGLLQSDTNFALFRRKGKDI